MPSEYENRKKFKHRNKRRVHLVSGVLATLLMVTSVDFDTHRADGIDKPDQVEGLESSSGLTEDANTKDYDEGFEKDEANYKYDSTDEQTEDERELSEKSPNEVEEGGVHTGDTLKDTKEDDEEQEKGSLEENTGSTEETNAGVTTKVNEKEDSNLRNMKSRIMMMSVQETVPNSAVSALDASKITNLPVGITVAGSNSGNVQSIEMISSPKQGRNYAKNYGKDEIRMPGYSLVYDLNNREELIGEELTVSFEAKTETEGGKAVINSIIYGGKSYPIDIEVTDEYQTYQYTIPKNPNINEFNEYSYVEIKRGNHEEVILMRNVKVELGNTQTPYTRAPEEIGFSAVSNYFSKNEWLSTTAEQKPKTTGVPYIDIQLEPNTEYTFSTNIGKNANGYYDVFGMDSSGFASSATNGVGVSEPRTVTTKSDGILRLAMREYDESIKDGSKWIMINKGDKAFPIDNKSKTYQVTSNGNYTFRVTYKDGSIRDTTVNVNNFVSVKGIPYRWTGTNVTLTMDASGGSTSKVTRIKLPNNQWVTGDSGSYPIRDNGTYTFVAEDKLGNQVTEKIVVDKIDKGLPTIQASHSPTEWTNKAVDIEVSAYDRESGVDTVEMTGVPAEAKDGGENLFLNSNFMFGKNNWAGGDLSGIFDVNDNTLRASGSGRFFYSIISLPIKEYYTVSFDARKDGNPSKVKVFQSGNEGDWGNSLYNTIGNDWGRYTQKIQIANTNTISFSLEDTSNVYEFRTMKIEKGHTATPWLPAVGDGVGSGSSKFPVVTNGVYEFTATDYAGNTAKVNHEVTNIDSTPPEISIIKTQNGYTNGKAIDLTFNVTDTQSGLAKITLPDGRVLTDKSSGMYTVYENGDYIFKLEDKVGNMTNHVVKMTQFDRTAPTVRVSGNPTTWSDKDEIALVLTAEDTQSGVKSITLPDKTVISGKTATYKVNANGDYSFIVTDNIGNTTTHKVTVDKIMTPYMFYLYDANGKPIKGAGFALLRDGVKYKEAESDDTGLVNFGKVPPTGTYTIKQIKAPDGYVIDPNEKDVEVGDTTEPEEFVSYPRGKILPATGTVSYITYLGLVFLTIVGWVTVRLVHKNKRIAP